MTYHIYATWYGYAIYRHQERNRPHFVARFDDLKTAAAVCEDLNK